MTMPLLQSAITRLKTITSTPQLEAETLLSTVLNIPRIKIWTQDNLAITPAQEKAFEALLTRRLNHEPLAYLIESKEFWKFRLKVTPATLIPREETEMLVTESLVRLPKEACNHILELGTGSGAIALALAYELPHSTLTAVDKSAAALSVAKDNASMLGLHNVQFVLSDWFENVDSQAFDLIVSNPPYIAFDDPALEDNVKTFEPQSAYYAGNQGLSDIEAIVNAAPRFLKEKGWLLIEHGYQQGALVAQIFQTAGFEKVATLQDLNGLDRVTLGVLQ